MSFISGFLGGLIAIKFINKDSRYILGLFLLARGFECYYNKLINEKKIPNTQYNWVLIFQMLWLIILGNQCYQE